MSAGAGLQLHSVVVHGGLDLWNAAADVRRRLDAFGALAPETRGASNGGLVDLILASSYLRDRPDTDVAVPTTADRWQHPFVDRWRADRGLIFGDGGATMVTRITPKQGSTSPGAPRSS